MFNLNIRFQLAAFVILAIIIIDFFRVPHLKTLSTKFFILLIAATGMNLCFDSITVYTVNHMEQVSPAVNMLCHQLFIGSVVIVLFMNFMYMSIISHDQRRYKGKWYLVLVAPLIVSVFVILKKELYYVQTQYGSYSYGPMAYIIYLCGTTYLIAVIWFSFDRANILTGYQRNSVRIACGLWICGLLIQIIFPYILLSGFGFVACLLVIYISFENQKMYMDQEVGGFNRSAFHRMFSEHYEKNGSLFLLNVVFENYGRMGSVLGIEAGNIAMTCLGAELQTAFSTEIYHSRGNVFTIFLDHPLEYYEQNTRSFREKLQEGIYEGYNLKIHLDFIDVRQYAGSKREAYDMLEFMAHRKYHQDCAIQELDQKIVDYKKRQDRIENLLENAMFEHSLTVYYQPIYNTIEQGFISAEALVRMKEDPELGYISPEEFIPIAEKKGLIMQIGDFVFRESARFIRDSGITKLGIRYIEINLSGIQISTKEIDQRLLHILSEEQVSPSKINLEITETAVIENDMHLVSNMNALRKAGFTFSMDDFGTGYSNLAQISKTKFELIKIDKSILWNAFCNDIETDANQREHGKTLLKSVIHMLHDMDMEIVVEGVETEEMADFLIQEKVEYLQGFLYSHPLPGDEFLRMCQSVFEK